MRSCAAWLAIGLATTAAGAAALFAQSAVHAWATMQQRSVGEALYRGRAVLSAAGQRHAGQGLAARLAGPGGDPLPAEAARCANCHDGERAIGPALTRATLGQARPRRGGPPSSYDATAFCRALRDGVDPAFVMLPRVMPRYSLEDEACAALWSYLYSR